MPTKNELNVLKLPDGSGVMVASRELPKDHWLYKEGFDEPPAGLRVGFGEERDELVKKVREAGRYALRASTLNGLDSDWDPDAVVQNFIVGLLGYFTHDGN